VAKRASNSMAGGRGAKGARGGPDGLKPIAFDDQTLVQRFRQGDMESFSLLVAKYQDRVYNMLLRMCGRPADAEELAQEAFLRAMERIGQFHGRSKFYTWLFRIAANLAISHRRRGGRIKFHSLTGPDDGDSSGEDALGLNLVFKQQSGPPEAAAAAEMNEYVMAALAELDDEFRLVIVLRDIEEMDYSQVADVIDVPVGTVKSRLHRARAMLKDKLRGLLDDYE
jgi:RNA polymerase sigma-70 factor (ECF subfamily)